MAKCCVPGCQNRTNDNYANHISFHRFPKDLMRKNLWLKAIKREYWTPSAYSVVCSDHFKEDCFSKPFNLIAKLLPNAIPSRFERCQGRYMHDVETEEVLEVPTTSQLVISNGLPNDTTVVCNTCSNIHPKEATILLAATGSSADTEEYSKFLNELLQVDELYFCKRCFDFFEEIYRFKMHITKNYESLKGLDWGNKIRNLLFVVCDNEKEAFLEYFQKEIRYPREYERVNPENAASSPENFELQQENSKIEVQQVSDEPIPGPSGLNGTPSDKSADEMMVFRQILTEKKKIAWPFHEKDAQHESTVEMTCKNCGSVMSPLREVEFKNLFACNQCCKIFFKDGVPQLHVEQSGPPNVARIDGSDRISNKRKNVCEDSDSD